MQSRNIGSVSYSQVMFTESLFQFSLLAVTHIYIEIWNCSTQLGMFARFVWNITCKTGCCMHITIRSWQPQHLRNHPLLGGYLMLKIREVFPHLCTFENPQQYQIYEDPFIILPKMNSEIAGIYYFEDLQHR
ncbi:hypothetical protein ACJX0J_012630 [Zea mays]